MVELRSVSKIYPGKIVALSDVSFTVDKGEFVFIVGPSGAGKSTLIRLLYRGELPTRGQVIVNGKNVARLRPEAVPYLRRSVGVVFQDYKLLPDRTVAENLAFVLEATEASAREIRRRVPMALEVVGLKHRGNAYPLELSGGEQQRVAIARGIVNSPPLLLADEPTGNLDPETAWDIMKLFGDINRAGTTVVMATHAQNIVNAMRRRVIVMDRGRVVSDREQGGYAYAAR